MQNEPLTIGIICLCIVLSAYFSATETAFSSFNRIRVKSLADNGNRRARLVLKLSENYDKLLSTILIGNNIVNIASASLATVLFVKWVGEANGPGISTIVTTVVVLIFGEVSPKSIAKESPERFAMFAAPMLRCIVWIFTPFNFLFGLWKKLLSAIFRPQEDRGITEEELLTMVEVAEQEGGIGEQESTLIKSAIEFSELCAEDVLTPRIDVDAVEEGDSPQEIAAVFAETGHSRLPVYRESLDHIQGILYLKDFHRCGGCPTPEEVQEMVRPALFITPQKKIGILLRELQQRKLHIAVVLDEYGGTMGIVTLEDILEELVGEIWDEHDEVTSEIQKIGEDEYVVMGGTELEGLMEYLHHTGPLPDVSTAGGWVMERLGRVPVPGDSFTDGDLQVEVLEMDNKRVLRIRIRVLPQHKEQQA